MKIAVTGSIAYDYLMKYPGRFSDEILPEALEHISLSFHVESMSRHWGGTAANISYTTALLKGHAILFGTVGAEDFGPYREWLAGVGVDLGGVIELEGQYTASYFGNTDRDNNLLAAFYGGAMDAAHQYTLAGVLGEMPDYVVISPGEERAMIQVAQECAAAGIPFMFDPSQQISRLTGEQLRTGLNGAHTFICNAYEFQQMQNKTGLSADDIRRSVRVFVETRGADGSVIVENDENGEPVAAHDIPAFKPERVVEPTGAGDAYRAGILKGLSQGWPLEVAGRAGALCSSYVLERTGTQTHAFTPAEFVARFRTQFDDGGVLDDFGASG